MRSDSIPARLKRLTCWMRSAEVVRIARAKSARDQTSIH